MVGKTNILSINYETLHKKQKRTEEPDKRRQFDRHGNIDNRRNITHSVQRKTDLFVVSLTTTITFLLLFVSVKCVMY